MMPDKRDTAGFFTVLFGIVLVYLVIGSPAAGQGEGESAGGRLSLEDILAGVESRYGGAGFSARFEQRSILKAMDLADTASGSILVKRPGKMRWTYETPEEQLIITDGTDLWVYKPEDNQVAVGRAPTFFGDGKGASFLSDMKLVREKFEIRLENSGSGGFYVLSLTPIEPNRNISTIYLTVSAQFDVQRIVTYNAYGDENRIDLKEIAFKDSIDDAFFTFVVPEGVDVLRLNESF
jgi:outer membrane lipoprotein carrier protein